MTDPFREARRLVVKVGSALLTPDPDAGLNVAWLQALVSDLVDLRGEGKEVLIVSSGAVALGRRRLGLALRGALDLEVKQAAAAAGQSRLMRAWEEAFDVHAVPAAQVLLTRDDTEMRRRWLNARATVEALLSLGAVPVVNENDTVATDEIRYGDNDRLAARVAQMIDADVLVLLSDVDGLYTADPRKDPDARHVPVVEAVTDRIEAMAGGANLAAGVGAGGMATKVQAAAIARRAGCATIIAAGRNDGLGPLGALRAGGRHTRFQPDARPVAAKKHWIAGALAPQGVITVDAGAAAALSSGKSLLPAGVVDLQGAFEKGDAVLIVAPGGRPLAKGLAGYAHHEARRIMGKRSNLLESTLGYRGPQALVHRNDLVLVD